MTGRPEGGQVPGLGPRAAAAAYPSRIDAWLVLLLVAVPVWLAWDAWRAFRHGHDAAGWVVLGVLILVVAISTLALFPCRYRLESHHLHIRCGLLQWRIAYRDIVSIEPSGSWLSAPALSLRRVRIRHGRYGVVLVSPRDRERFIRELRQRLPGG